MRQYSCPYFCIFCKGFFFFMTFVLICLTHNWPWYTIKISKSICKTLKLPLTALKSTMRLQLCRLKADLLVYASSIQLYQYVTFMNISDLSPGVFGLLCTFLPTDNGMQWISMPLQWATSFALILILGFIRNGVWTQCILLELINVEQILTVYWKHIELRNYSCSWQILTWNFEVACPKSVEKPIDYYISQHSQ